MPVRKFTGELDKPKARPFTGKLDGEESQSGVMERGNINLSNRPIVGNADGTVSTANLVRQRSDEDSGISPSDLITGSYKKTEPLFGFSEGSPIRGLGIVPGLVMNRAPTKNEIASALPAIGGIAGALAVPGAGWGALALQSLAAAGGGAAGELGRQGISGEQIDTLKAGKEGAVQGIGGFAGGSILKGLGLVASKLFSSRLDEGAKAAAQAAREMGAPFPLGQVKPSPMQIFSSQSLGGRIGNQRQAVRVAQYLNRTVGTMTQKAQVFDEAALKGQQFLREIFGEGETAIRGAFTRYKSAVGAEAQVPTANTLVAVRQAADRLEARGQTAGGLYQRLRTILKKDPQGFTTEEFDELYGAIIKQSFSSKGRAGGEGRIILEAITHDLDSFGRKAGVNFGEEIAAASKIREQYRELRDIPQLERLSEGFGEKFATKGSIDWMNTLFRKENGMALGKLRKLNPDLYHDLADAWLARHIDSFSINTQGNIGRVLNGDRLRTWFEQNSDTIKEVLGTPQFKALDNFTIYARHLGSAARQADAGISPTQAITGFGLTGGFGTSAALAGNLPLMIPTESAAFVLARGITNPNSTLFKLFTDGFSATTRTAMIRAAAAGGQAAALQTER